MRCLGKAHLEASPEVLPAKVQHEPDYNILEAANDGIEGVQERFLNSQPLKVKTRIQFYDQIEIQFSISINKLFLMMHFFLKQNRMG